jgi:excisionase family DNA binding protein
MQSAKSSRAAVEPIEFPPRTAPNEDIRRSSERHPGERLLTPREVAERLGVSQRWVRDHATRRWPRLTAVKLGPLLRFRWADVEDFLARHTLPSSSKKQAGGV